MDIVKLQKLFSDKKEVEEKKRILEAEYGFEMTREIEEEVAEMCNLSQCIALEEREENEDFRIEIAKMEKTIASNVKTIAKAEARIKELEEMLAKEKSKS